MWQSTTIHSDNDEITLKCLCDGDRLPDKQFVWITFKELKSKVYPEYDLEWDNPPYIFEIFYEFLHRLRDGSTVSKDKKLISKRVWKYLMKNDSLVDDLIEMLDEAIKQGWYETNNRRSC